LQIRFQGFIGVSTWPDADDLEGKTQSFIEVYFKLLSICIASGVSGMHMDFHFYSPNNECAKLDL